MRISSRPCGILWTRRTDAPGPRWNSPEREGPDKERFRKIVFEEVDNLKQLYETIDWEMTVQVVDCLEKASRIAVVGSRLSYTLAYYMGWSFMKIRPDVRILKGSDSTTIDWLTIAPPETVVVIIATTRYPQRTHSCGQAGPASRSDPGRPLPTVPSVPSSPLRTSAWWSPCGTSRWWESPGPLACPHQLFLC